MTEIAYRPRSVPEIIDASIQLFRRTFRELAAIMAIGYVPWVAISTLVTSRLPGAPEDPTQIFGDTLSVIVTVVGMIWLSVVGAGCIAAASDRYLGRQPEIGRSLARALSRAWPIIATSAITWLLTIAGLILLIFPGLYLFSRYAMSSTVALLESRPTGESLSRASKLSEGRKLHIFVAILAAWAIYLVVAITVGAIVGLLSITSLTPVLEAVITVGIAPLISAVTAVLYYDLRIRGEGFDVELMEQQLRTAPEPAA